MTLEDAKRAAGRKAAELIQPNSIVGLGTGTTAAFFIEELALRVQKGLRLKAVVCSSRQSEEFAKKCSFPVQSIQDQFHIDTTVDGADEIDPLKRMIKGGGGAHVREKILASCSKEMIVIVDETKLVSSLGTAKLPVEILSYGSEAAREKLHHLGYRGKWRTTKNNTPFISDNGNPILDIFFPSPPEYPEQEHEKIMHVPGVIDTGFFFNLAGRVIIGYQNGRTEILR